MRKFDKNTQLRKLHNKKNNSNTKIISIVLSITILVGAIIYFTFARFESTTSFNLISGTANIQSISLIDKINELKTNGSAELEYDETIDNNLRYIGTNPNNYVEFNGELWRIIGVMNNIEKEDGTTESLVKIRRAESLGDYSWDTSESSINSGYGINQWGESGTYEGADLMRELNTDYLGNITVGTDGKWYNGSNNSKTSNMPTSTLSTSAQSMIETVKWNLGSPSNNEGTFDSNWKNNTTSSTSYTRERANTNGKVCSSGIYCNDTVNRTSAWTGKVGLIYPSDYGYATAGGTTTNRETCLNKEMYNWNSSEVSDCKNNDWLLQSLWQWTLSPYAYSSFSYRVFYVRSDGHVDYYYPTNTMGVFPVVFLQSDITIISGNGSSEKPYKLIYQPKLSDHIISQASVDENLKYDGTDSLGEYGTTDNNLRYTGLTPNNYVYYNCSTTKKNEMNDETCEKWRIIGLFNNVEDAEGNLTSRVKIIRDESLGEYSLDSSTSGVNSGVGVSQWGPSTYTNSNSYEGADLMRELNTDYLGNITIGTDGKWYTNSQNKKDKDMPSVTLNEQSQKMIKEVVWHTGALGYYNTMAATYEEEKSKPNWRGSENNQYQNDTVVRNSRWLGKVGLMNFTDFAFSTAGGSTINYKACVANGLYYWDFNNDLEECRANSWLNSNEAWTINFRETTAYGVIAHSGILPGTPGLASAFEVKPSVYLNDSIFIVDGNGSSTNPYKLSMK